MKWAFMEGPRGAKKSDLDSLRHITSVVFRESLMDEYPQLFNEDNLENCRVMLDKGQVVSHVGMTEQGASILGCQVKVACIGGVSTLPEYRKRGFATRLFDDACAKAYADGIDFMIVSGDRGIYRRAGCRRVGRDSETTITPKHASRFDATDLTIEKCTEVDIPKIASIYRMEPVRFLRRKEDYQRAFACEMVMNRFSDFLSVKKDNSMRAYLIIQRPDSEGNARLAEYAGERVSIVNILGKIVNRYGLVKLGVHISAYDTLMKSLLKEKGLQFADSHASGTVRLVNFPQFMERMRPYFEDVLGYKQAGWLKFVEKEGQFRIIYGSEQLTLSGRGDMVQLLFDSLEVDTRQYFTNNGELASMLGEILPIPALWYGVNYV